MSASREQFGEPRAIILRRMSAADVPAGVLVLNESPEASLWSNESLLRSVSGGIAWVAERNGCTAGILVGRVAADEFEILNMAVMKQFRRKGIASELLNTALQYGWNGGASQTHLEVRASNAGAISLYARHGFRICGQRPNYYHHPAEDAVLMVLRKNEINA